MKEVLNKKTLVTSTSRAITLRKAKIDIHNKFNIFIATIFLFAIKKVKPVKDILDNKTFAASIPAAVFYK